MSYKENLSTKGFWIWFLCAVFFTYEFMLRTIFGTFEHPLIHDLSLTLITFSILSSTAYQILYGVMQIPAGIVLDKFGLKNILTLAIAVCALASMSFAFTHQFSSAFVFRLMMGLGSSFGFIGLLVAVYDWMPSNKTGFFIGLSQFIGTLGPMLAAGPINAITDNGGLSWRLVFFSLGILGIILSIFVFIIVENNRDYAGGFQILKRSASIKSMLKSLVKQPQAWFIAIYSASIYFAIEYLSENSGKDFLMLHGYSSQSSSNLITLAWLSYAIGCPLLGYISDLICRRKQVLIAASVICLLSGILIIYMAHIPSLLYLGFCALGIGASGQSVAFATIAEQCEAKYLAVGLGFNNACIVFLASANAPLIAMILHRLKRADAPITLVDYQLSFSVLILFMGLSLLTACFFIKETYCKSTKSATKLSY